MLRTVLLLALLTLAFAPAPLPKKERSPPPRLEGLWQRIESERPPLLIQITARQLIYRPDARDETACDLVVHRHANPPAYDFSHRADKWSGIFRLEGDRLALCYRHGNNRPTDLFTGGGQTSEVYQRVR